MDKFITISDNFSVATQIASLLNKYNKLQVVHTGYSILSSCTKYIIEQKVYNNSIIVSGCLGINYVNNNSLFLKHLSVHEAFRGSGIGTSLINTALFLNANIPNIFMNIRNDNLPSLQLAEKLGFLVVDYKMLTHYNIITVGKTNGTR